MAAGASRYRPNFSVQLVPLNDDWRVINSTAVGSGAAVDLTGGTPLDMRRAFLLKVLSGVTIFVGPTSAVTAAGALRGFQIKRGEAMPALFGQDMGVWGITAAGTADVQLLEGA